MDNCTPQEKYNPLLCLTCFNFCRVCVVNFCMRSPWSGTLPVCFNLFPYAALFCTQSSNWVIVTSWPVYKALQLRCSQSQWYLWPHHHQSTAIISTIFQIVPNYLHAVFVIHAQELLSLSALVYRVVVTGWVPYSVFVWG